MSVIDYINNASGSPFNYTCPLESLSASIGRLMKREPAWIRVVRPPLVAVGFVLNTIYSVLFGWWLDGRLSQKLDGRLAKEIHQNLAFLFTQKNARIVPSDEYKVKRAFDPAVVTVATEDLRIRFVRVRGQFEVEVSSPHLLHRWEDLSSALENAELSEGASLTAVVSTRRLRSYSSYTDVERLLRSQWLSLKRYCDNCSNNRHCTRNQITGCDRMIKRGSSCQITNDPAYP